MASGTMKYDGAVEAGTFSMMKLGTSTVVESGNWIANPILKIVEASFNNLQTGAQLSPSDYYYVGSLPFFKPYSKITCDVNRFNGASAVGTLEISTLGEILLYPLETIPTGVTLRAHVTYFYTGN